MWVGKLDCQEGQAEKIKLAKWQTSQGFESQLFQFVPKTYEYPSSLKKSEKLQNLRF